VKQTPLMRKTELRRSRKPLSRGRRKRRLSVPPETTMAVRARSEGKCVVCVHQGRGRPKKAEHRHHCLPVQKWPELELVADNLVGVCSDCHDQHHHGIHRIPLLALPECVFRLAADVGPAAVDYLLSRYEDGSRLAREAG
jgi:5-methylcytosine-specific restriction endonuclease McrA